MLMPWACDPSRSRGRRHEEVPAPTRNDFQRDRDRIVHCSSFRRLVYKTQVFLNHEGDLYRTRLTHTLEVAQIARSIARAVGLNEDLCEAISLAHDLGHTPFGHAGQDALDECLRQLDPRSAGFEHNFQSLRVVDRLEERYAAFDGLNLTFETREGILKHCSRRRAVELEAQEPGGVGRRFLAGLRPSLEAQLCNLADEIAYNVHDIDDGIRSGLIEIDQLLELRLFEHFHEEALREAPALSGRRLLYEVLRRMLSAQVYDVIEVSAARIGDQRLASVDDVRAAPALISAGPEMISQLGEVKSFLRTKLYRHPQVVATTESAKQVVRTLFDAYLESPDLVPGDHLATDYIAGMTDRFALREYQRLTGRSAEWAS